jgi:thymidylate synthase
MIVLKANNVNEAYRDALWNMRVSGVNEKTRNGLAKVHPQPVSTVYANPTQRMLYDVKRNANPFFHVMEAIWMLAGRNDVAFVATYAANMKDFSDDGLTLNGAYGYRWRHHFDGDQLVSVIELLAADYETRRAVLAMWDPSVDADGAVTSKDVPCNTHAYFRVVRGDTLNITVCNRSNDIIWGCYGANAVHMSFLLEFVANAVGLNVGTYTQVSNNWHMYEQHFPLLEGIDDPDCCMYSPDWTHVPVMSGDDDYFLFLEEINTFICNVLNFSFHGSYKSSYINWVLQPMARAWDAYKRGNFTRAVQYTYTIKDTAILVACANWLQRKQK